LYARCIFLKANFLEVHLDEVRRINLPRTRVNKGKRKGHRMKLRPVLGRAASVAGATLERFKARSQVRWRNFSTVDQVAELVGIGIQVVILLQAVSIFDVLPAVARANAVVDRSAKPLSSLGSLRAMSQSTGTTSARGMLGAPEHALLLT
jgi:hypothetical protein